MLTAKIVGMHFRPPAKAVLAVLPSGCQLRLKPEPDNPYDVNAVQVLVSASQVHKDRLEQLASEAMGYGFGLEEIVGPNGDGISADGKGIIWHLGYVDSKKSGMAQVFAAALAGREAEATLAFDATGWPLVQFTVFCSTEKEK